MTPGMWPSDVMQTTTWARTNSSRYFGTGPTAEYGATIKKLCTSYTPILNENPTNTFSIHPLVLKPLLFQYCFAD